MAVRPVAFHADGSVDVVHDDGVPSAHSGTVAPAQIQFYTDPSGTPDHRFIVLPCPVTGCNSVSLQPIGGGHAPAAVQELFVRTVARAGCACGAVAAGKPVPIVQSHVKLQTERMNGAGSWAAGTLK